MIQSLTIENFRGFERLNVKPVKRINLIAGENNTGKTAILEALYLLLLNDSNQLGALPSTFRSASPSGHGMPTPDDFKNFWEFLFRDNELDLVPIIRAERARESALFCRIEIGKQQNVSLSHQAQGPQISPFSVRVNACVGGHNPAQCKFLALSSRLSDPARDAELYNQASLPGGNEEKLLGLIKVIEPRLEKLRYAKIPGTTQPMVYAYTSRKNPIPVTQAGQGFSKLLTLFSEMLVSKAQVILIDELENGLYYAILPEIWRGIAAVAEAENIQIFATTHSRECIVAAHECFKETPDYNFALHRLQRVKDRIEAVSLDKGMLEVAIKSGLEVR